MMKRATIRRHTFVPLRSVPPLGVTLVYSTYHDEARHHSASHFFCTIIHSEITRMLRINVIMRFHCEGIFSIQLIQKRAQRKASLSTHVFTFSTGVGIFYYFHSEDKTFEFERNPTPGQKETESSVDRGDEPCAAASDKL